MSEQEQSVSQKVRVQWLIDAELIKRAELHAMEQEVRISQFVESLLAALPALKISREEPANAA